MTATTPSGTLTLRRSSPLGSRWPSMTSPTGSGSATIDRTAPAIAEMRAGSSASRSISASERPDSRPASRSRALASRISGARSSSASATRRSAGSLSAVLMVASTREALLGARQGSETVGDATAIDSKSLGEHEVVPVDRFLGRARQHLAHLGGLAPHDPPPLGRRVVADPLAHGVVRQRPDLDGVAGVERSPHLDDPDRQQRRPALAQRPRRAGIDAQRAL